MTKRKHFDRYYDRYEWGVGAYLAYDKAAELGSLTFIVGHWNLYFYWGGK